MFEIEGRQFTLEELQGQAEKQGLDFDVYYDKLKSQKNVVELENQNTFLSKNVDPFSVQQPDIKVKGLEELDAPKDLYGTTKIKPGEPGYEEFVDKPTFKNLKEKAILGAYQWTEALAGLFDYANGIQTNIEVFTRELFGDELTMLEKQDIYTRNKTGGVGYPTPIQTLDMVSDYLEGKIVSSDTSIAQDLMDGNYVGAADKTTDGMVQAIPSLVAARLGPWGMVALGISTAGNKFEEELFAAEEDTNTGLLLLNASGSGAIEAGFEIMTRGLLKRAGFINDQTTAQQAKEFLTEGVIGGAKKILGGFITEGFAETATELISTYWDNLSLGREVDPLQLIHRLVDTFIVGGAVGKTIATAGQINKLNPKAREKAYNTLMNNSDQILLSKIAEEANELSQIDLRTTDDASKELIEKKLAELRSRTNRIKGNNKLKIQNMSKEELQNHVEAIGKQNQLRREYFATDNKIKKSLLNREFNELQKTIDEIGAGVESKVYDLYLGNIKAYADDIGAKIEVYNEKNGGVEAAQKRYEELTGRTDDITEVDGYYDPKSEVMIINEIVAKQKGAISVASHEFLHRVIRNTYTNLTTKQKKNLNKSFFDLLNEDQKAAVRNRFDENQIFGDDIFTSEEMFTYFSDAVDKGEISFNENIFNRALNMTEDVLRFAGRRAEFENARQVYSFLKTYHKTIKKGKRRKRITKFAEQGKDSKTTEVRQSMTAAEKANAQAEVKKLGAEGLLGDNFTQEGGKFLFDASFDDIYNKIKSEGYLDNLIASKFKGETVPKDFVDKVYAELTSHAKRFNPEQNDDFFGYLNSQIANKAGNVYNKEYKADKTTAGRARDIGETTQEGEVKVQVAAETDATLEALETEDLSVVGQAKLKQEKAEKQSKFRRALGFDTGGEMYNNVLGAVKKSLLIAYRKTQNIKNPFERAIAIREAIRKEYFTKGLTSDLFKPIKDFLGAKPYIKNLKQHREAIVNAISTADFVQMERKIPDNERIFTTFVKKLTSKQEVQDAVNKNLLPLEALNKIDKGQAVNLYKKRMPSEVEFISYADQPAVNPITGARSGLKGTRKDGFAKAMANTLALDALMEVRQQEGVVEALDNDVSDLIELSAVIGREVDVKFSKTEAEVKIDLAIDGIDTRAYSEIRFSRSHREAYENRLTKKRTDLSEEQIKGAVESVFKFVEGDNIPNNKKSKYEKMAMHYMANGYLILPEDGYKIIEVERLASIKKIDPFSVGNPNEIIEKYAGTVKAARINPKNVKELSNPKELVKGVVSYVVEWTKNGQKAVRAIVDSHWGKKSNPWCLIARQGNYLFNDDVEFDPTGDISELRTQEEADAERDRVVAKHEADGKVVQVHKHKAGYEIIVSAKPDPENELKSAYTHWLSYNEDPDTNEELDGYKLIFQNGKLTHFQDGRGTYWDKQDAATNFLSRDLPDAISKDGYTQKRVLDLETGEVKITKEVKETGDKQNGLHVKARRDYGADRSYKYEDIQETIYKNGERVSSVRNEKNDYGKGDIRTFKTVFTEDGKMIRENTATMSGKINTDLLSKANRVFSSILRPGVSLDVKNILKVKIDSELTQDGDIASTVETYYGEINGKKAEVEIYYSGSNFDPSFKFNDVKVNGESALPSSAKSVKFSKTNSDVKFSFTKQLTELQRNNKTLPAILRAQAEIQDRIENERGVEGDLTALSVLQELERLVTLGNDALSTFDILTSKFPVGLDGVNIQFKTVDEFVKYVKDTTLPRIRQAGFRSSVIYLENKLKGKTLTQQKKIIDSFLKNIGRSTRTGAILGITTNRQLKENVIDQLLKGKFKGKTEKDDVYKLIKVESGEAFEGVELYTNIENIKDNVRADEDLKNKVNRQALEAESFIFEILDSDLRLSEKLAMIDLMALDQRGPVRKMYKMGATVVNNMPSKQLTLEHEITAADMVGYLKKYAKKQIDKEALEEIISKARVHVLPKKIEDILKKAKLKSKGNIKRYQHPEVKKYLKDLQDKKVIDFIPADISLSEKTNTIANAVLFSRSVNEPKGITVLDFDDTLATSKSLIRFTRADGTKGTLTPEQYAATYEDLADLGYKFDFSEFSKVVDGKPAPLLNKAKKLAGKFGTKNMFILTARPADSAPAIKQFLKENGLDIPLENITGLGNSTSEAKALWIADKVADGYNDFYFADDALKNVQAVKNMLDQFDVKSKVQQAKVKFSKTLSPEFNEMIERVKGIGAEKTFSRVAAQKRGKNIGKFRFFVPPSADDFTGLLRYFVGKGEQGNKDLKFFKKALIDPFARADEDMKRMRQTILEDYKTLRKTFPEVTKKLRTMIGKTGFSHDNAVRVYLWNKAGFEIPGLSEADVKMLTNVVATDQDLKNYAEVVASIANQPEGYLEPGQQWDVESIGSDLQNVVNKVGRKKFLAEWVENKNEIFSSENLNKIEAVYGSNFREALENILWRMENGTNRAKGMGRIESAWNNWINGSVGAIMFFNARSAVLQTLSTVNFINFEDNNIFAAAKAFANQKQYWKDFSFLFNSSFLKQRRAGLQTNINEAELASAVAGATNKAKAAIQYILKIGFTPTQVADSFAIASGGATYYRNRIKKYVKEGMDQKAAEKQAMLDFQEIAEETQQSARPDRISQQQASSLGRIILAFANTPMQYNRLIKKAAGDLLNKRGDWRSNVSRIIYYGALQNIIFTSLQSAIFALAFDDEEPEEDEIDQKTGRILHGTIDTLLRGSGIAGAVVSTIKNTVRKFMEEDEKSRPEFERVLIEALQISPPIGSKVRKIYSALKTYEYNRDVIPEMGNLNLENPIYSIVGNVTEATVNLPLARLLRKIDNMKEVFNQDNQTWQRVALALGWDQWSLGIDPYKEVKEAEKELRAKKNKKKPKKFKRR